MNMSNPYLERLRVRAEEKTETQHPSQPSKPPKPSFDSFGGDQSMCFFENEAAEEESENLKNASPRDRQNRQNLDLPAEPNAAYRATSVGPDGVGCKVEIVELPQAPRYRKAFGVLQLRPPALVPVERWKACVRDGSRLLAKWGNQAEALGWTSADLFGLHAPPEQPHPSYSRLSRYDATGLCWLSQGKEVIALTADTATIRNPATGSLTTYRRFNKPALGPLGDSLEDFK